MELKQIFRERPILQLILLIEPMWNWNKVFPKRALNSEKSFNWTNVELKLHSSSRQRQANLFLLIEPMWNWNSFFTSIKIIWPRLLIEPMWNWNPGALLPPKIPRKMLLIEPMWNWNRWGDLWRINQVPSFNWTNVELKRNCNRRSRVFWKPFNWTNVELKQIRLADGARFGVSFNWTNVELKRVWS